LRIVKVFWSLDAALAYKRHFPAINWLSSYSLYVDSLTPWFEENVAKEFPILRQETMILLQEEAELNEIVQLVGVDALSPADRIKLEACRSIREDYLHQNAFHEVDTYASTAKQYQLLTLILEFYKQSMEGLAKGAYFMDMINLDVREAIGRFKYVEEAKCSAEYEKILSELKAGIQNLIAKGAEQND
jgi:V/A-type H+-transporting ATPase subunit A